MAWTDAAREKLAAAALPHASGISDEVWAVLEPLLPEASRMGRPRGPLRRLVGGIVWMLETGSPWRYLPRQIAPFSTVMKFYYKLRDDGTLESINHALVMDMREAVGREASPTGSVMDSQSVKTANGGPRGYDAAKHVLGRKRHVVVDTEGNLVGVRVSPASEQDRDGIVPLLERLRDRQPWLRFGWADSGYDAAKLAAKAAELGWTIEIVKRSDDMKGFVVLPRRWVVERTLAWLSHCRRLAKDYERTIKSSEAWVYLASIRRMARRLAAIAQEA